MEEAKSLGDLSENTEYSAAKEAQSFNEGRILELEDMIRNIIVIQPGKDTGSKKKVGLGSVIEVRSSLRKHVFNIVGSQEAEPSQGKISNESPLGKAFLGHEVGDVVDVEIPGKKVRYKIVNIK